MISVDEYSKEVECQYKNEHYLVRDNGAVYRFERTDKDKRKRKRDGVWTFGEKRDSDGYMYLDSARVHIIVATAFFGANDSKVYVVDHIDTNRCNNRIENLRWLTRLENILRNPITVKKICYYCGSVEEFLKNPQQYRHLMLNSNCSWMRTVTKEEGQRTLAHLSEWANSDSWHKSTGEGLGEWIFREFSFTEEQYWSNIYHPKSSPNDAELVKPESRDLILQSLSPNAFQKNWQTPTSFPLCPEGGGNLHQYLKNLALDKEITRNTYGSFVVKNYALVEDSKIVVVCFQEGGVKPWGLIWIESYNETSFVHSCRLFFDENGANKHFALEKGEPWLGGDCIDDYC